MAENILNIINDPDSDVTFFPETNPSVQPLTFQGDFFVSMIGKGSPGALRCKNAESRDVLREQLKRRPEGERHGTCCSRVPNSTQHGTEPEKFELCACFAHQ